MFFFLPRINRFALLYNNVGREATAGQVRRHVLGPERRAERNPHAFGTGRLSSVRSINHNQQRMGPAIF